MKNKILKCNYDKETGKSTITIACRYGEFSASAKVHEEDKPYASRFLGCEIAEKKALIKALKSHRKDLLIQKKELDYLYGIADKSNYKVPRYLHQRRWDIQTRIDQVDAHIAAIEMALDVSVENYLQKAKDRSNK